MFTAASYFNSKNGIKNIGRGVQSLSPAASIYAKKDEEEKNKGGPFGGIGYFAEKLGLGLLQGIEGIWDYAAGGIADLFGGDDWAEQQFKSDWLNYNHADDWYNPGEGWKVAGDVAGGIGTSLPSIAAAAVMTYFSGGSALPAAVGLVTGSLSAAGTATKEAVQESGELTGKEYLYGAGMGAVEAVTEKISGGLGAGLTKATKSVGKVFGKVAAEATEAAAEKGVSLSVKTAVKQAGREFAGEAFEEGFSEFVAPYIARVTYDPNAKNASAQDILYSALIGGLSGVGTGGGVGAFTQGVNYYSGKRIVKNGRTQQIMDLAKTYTEEGASKTEAANGIRELYGKLSSAVQSGAGLNAEQQRMLGELAAFETQEQLRPMVQRSAIHAIQSADVVAERLNAVGRYKMVDGKLTDTQANNSIPEGAEVREITAEDIRGAYDPKNKKSLAKALKTNDVLRFIAASDAAGRLMLTAKDVEKSVLTGTRIHTQAELNEFITSASAEQKAAVGKELGIEDWNTLTVEEFAKKASAYRESGKAEAYKKKAAKVQKMQELADSKARNIPRAIALADGAVQRYADADSNFAVARDGDTYIVYDYATGNVTRDMTRAEVNAALGRYRRSRAGSETSADVNAKNTNASENLSSALSSLGEYDSIRTRHIESSGKDRIARSVAEIKSFIKSAKLNETFERLHIGILSDATADLVMKKTGIDVKGYDFVLSSNFIFHIYNSHGNIKSEALSGQRAVDDSNIENIIQTVIAPDDVSSVQDSKGTPALRFEKNLDGRNIAITITSTKKSTLTLKSAWIINKKSGGHTPSANAKALAETPKANSRNSTMDSIPEKGAKVNTSDEKSAKSLSEMLPMEEKAKPTAKQVKAAMEAKAQAAAIESLAKEKIKDYADLSKENQSMIRKVLREAMASGISEADALSYARVAARTGLDITFDKKACYNEEKGTYAAGFYDPENNRIVINPETKRKHASLLIHELSHAIHSYIGKDGKRHYKAGIDDVTKISDEMWEKINADYRGGTISETQTELRIDEASAYYAEKMLGTDTAIDLLLGEKPTLQQKILSFFKKSAQDYSSDEVLSRESRKFLREYKALFDRFSARNRGRNIEARNDGDQSARRFAINENIESEINNALNNKFYRNHVKLTENTPDILLSQKGVRNLPLYMKPSHVRENIFTEQEALSKGYKVGNDINYHGLGKTKFIEVVSDLDNVVEAYRGTKNADNPQRREKYFLLISKIKDVDGNVINVPIYINEKADYHSVIVDTNKVATVFGKEELRAYLQKELKKGNLVRIKKKSLQVGDGTAPIAAAYDSKASNNSISDSAEKVNTSDEISLEKSSDSRRYAMEDIDPAAVALPRKAGTMSVGQYKKRVADLMKTKSYSKDQIYDIVKKLPMASLAMEKTREQVAEAIWQIYNEDLTAGERREAAHDISEFLVARLMTEAKEDNPKAAEANEEIAYLRTGIGRLAFSPEDIAEIKHNVDKDGWRRILGRWGFKGKRNADGSLQGVRTPMEVFVTDIAREMPGMAYLEDMHPVEAFLEIDAYYSRVKEDASEKKISAFLSMSDEDISSLAKSIEETIVDAYDRGGGKSIFMKRIEQGISYHEQKASRYKQEFDEIKGRDKINGLLMNQAQKMKDLKLGSFANVTEGANETFKKTIGALASIQYRGNLSVTNAKKAIKDLYVWYTSKEVKENLFGFTAEDPGLWQEGVAEMMEALAENESKGFEKVELYALLDVLTYFTHFVKNFGKVWHHGEWVDAKELATNFIQVAQNQSPIKHKLLRDLAKKYMQTFGDPAAVVRMMDQYQDGFFTQIFDDLREAAISARYAEGEILSAYNEFLKKNKRYVENASKNTVQYRGVEIPKMHLIGLYMTMKRKHAQAGYAINGFSFKTEKGDTVRVRGSLDPDTVYTKQEIEDYVNRERAKIETLLSDADKQYISILEKVYNEDAKRLKADRDIQRFGMTNATSDYYYPIRRANTAQKLDSDMQMEIDRVSSASFNKDTVKGAKQELFIESADKLFNRHVHVVCQYAYLTPVLDMQKMLYNTDISGNPNHPISIHTETQNIWPDGFRFFREMVSDVQGIPRSTSTGMKFLSTLRGNYAKFQLGANPKTWVTQLSSLFAASGILDASSIVKGLGMSGKGFEEYSKLAKIRVEDNAAAKAQGVLDNKAKRATDSIGDALMAPIGMMDKFVVGKLYCACQVQIEKDGGAKIGSEENRIEAGKLLTRVILETQQNSLATERSAAMRSGNEFYRALTMFRSDSMKVIGRVIDGFGEVSALKGLLKNKEMNADSRKELEARLKRAEKKTAKASAALVLSAVFMALIAQGFRWLYAKEKDEDETFAETLLVDSLGNMLGGLPGFADVYTKMVEGYDVGNYSYSAINDVLDSAKGLFDIADGLLTGEGTAQERMRAIRNASYSLGQVLGIPTRNAFNVVSGLTKRVSKKAGYAIDNAFYEKNYKTDLYKAIEDGNDGMATYIMGLLLGERLDQSMDDVVFSEILALSKKGYKVLPRTMPKNLTVNDEEYELTDEEQNALREEYSAYTEGLSRLVSHRSYAALTDEEKEYAMDYVSDLYYDMALQSALGVERENKDLILSRALSVDTLALYRTSVRGLASDKDKDGNTVAGSKRKKVIAAINALGVRREERLLLIASSGYALQDGDVRGMSAEAANNLLLRYILSMKISKDEKAALAKACGFTVKNGKILKKSA